MKNWFIRLWYGRSVVLPLEVPHVCNLKYVKRKEYPKGSTAQCPVCSQKWKVVRISDEMYDFLPYRNSYVWRRFNE